ncbi:CAF17-like 4Fe-4S cluster assembly/insertion protein YgfZ [Hydrogenovibrio kuenenii]|uniref:CAF17-like 4Fe-4S cluster assembly/insertion protein YgfZ n=1 Tax=Hydrogenovibrio kuenenii TaxID=63658 RepID=UPI0004662FE9|nr:folate-binding protein YgfZ [Hydrogenovibrio kuenenii]
MNSEWKSFLQEQGANFNEQGSIKDFGNPELEHFLVKHGPILADLSHQTLIKVTGEETATFLQGQFSNDLNDVTDTKGQLTAYCEPQGKVLALITVFKQGEAYYLSFDSSLKDQIMQRLTMFKLRSKVELEDVSEQMIQIGYAGEFADLDLQRALSTKIKETYQVESVSKEGLEGVIGIKLPGPYHRYSLFGDIETIKQIWNTLSGNSEGVGQNDWALLNIVSGQPEVTVNTSNEFIAQFLNLDKLEAINFKKGCFPGQEIIARMHYRGKATKRMVRLHINEPLSLTSGEELVLQDDADRNYKFAIISIGQDIYEGSIALAVTTLKPLESAQGDLKTATGSIATIEPMPYDLAEE